jgi:serine/threonine-protein kinase
VPLGLVHRDVSPENILVTREGVAKLADFGVATARSNHGLITGESDLGRARGKVWYMAPEELWGEPVDRRADLFALGVVLYRMTTGRHPFGSQGDRKSVRRLLASTAPVAPRSFLPDYPGALESILMRVLAEKPEERPATALELRRAMFEAVPPASDDDVAQFLGELFSGRRLERDERLRVALDSRPGGAKPLLENTEHEVARSTFRQPSRRRFTRPGARAVGLALAGLAVGAFVSCALLERGGSKVTLPAVEEKVVGASLPVVAAAEPAPVAPPELATRVEERPVVPASLDEKPRRAEKSSIDVSPVREVGF